jgi:hypothetical protein
MPTGTEDQTITFTMGSAMTKNYRDSMSAGDILGAYVSRAALESLLAQDNAVGIRIYNAITSKNEPNFVIVAIDSQGDDLTGEGAVCINRCEPCPSMCSTANMLNT